MQAGIAIPDEIVAKKKEFQPMAKRMLVALVVKLDDQNKMQITHEFHKDDFNHEAFVKAFPDDEGRLAQYYVEWIKDDGSMQCKHVTILWSPDNALSRKKFIYTTCKPKFKDTFKSHLDLQVSDRKNLAADVLLKNIKEKC